MVNVEISQSKQSFHLYVSSSLESADFNCTNPFAFAAKCGTRMTFSCAKMSSTHVSILFANLTYSLLQKYSLTHKKDKFWMQCSTPLRIGRSTLLSEKRIISNRISSMMPHRSKHAWRLVTRFHPSCATMKSSLSLKFELFVSLGEEEGTWWYIGSTFKLSSTPLGRTYHSEGEVGRGSSLPHITSLRDICFCFWFYLLHTLPSKI